MPLLLGLAALCILGDLALATTQREYGATLAVDYAIRLIVLSSLLVWRPARSAIASAFKAIPGVRFLLWVAGLAAAARLLDVTLRFPLDARFPELALFRWPAPDSDVLFLFDLTFGLALVAASEELLFRVFFAAVAAPLLREGLPTIAASALLFALAHWSQGPGAALAALGMGALYMAAYLRTGSILPSLFGHYAVDLHAFWLAFR